MLPRVSYLSLAIVVLAGCSASNNYDSTQNPFDEPVGPQSKVLKPLPDALPPVDRSARARPSAREQQSLPDDSGVVVIPVAPDRMIETVQQPDIEAPHIQEMLYEANRLGASGDLDAKAELLTQAGYSGSAKAFYDLARMYLDGSLPKDMALSVKYITLAHEAGYSEATRVLGMLYLRGQGVPADEHYGRLLMEQASKHSIRAAREYGQLLVNQATPELNDPELGIQYLRDAAGRGDGDAAQALSKALASAGPTSKASDVVGSSNIVPPTTNQTQAPSGLKDRAMRGDKSAMFDYAQQIMLRKIPSSDPEFTAYCWLSAAEKLGSQEASKELGFISGVRVLSDKKNPGRLDQCINDLQYQIRG
jgi:hypothetical protein